MSRSLRIPGLIDLIRTDARSEIRDLAVDGRLDRRFEARGPLINRILLHILLAETARAQIQVELKFSRVQYVAYEPVIASVQITNLAGRDIELRDGGGQQWFGFEVTAAEERLLAPENRLAEPPLSIQAGQSVTRKINLTRLYPDQRFRRVSRPRERLLRRSEQVLLLAAKGVSRRRRAADLGANGRRAGWHARARAECARFRSSRTASPITRSSTSASKINRPARSTAPFRSGA